MDPALITETYTDTEMDDTQQIKLVFWIIVFLFLGCTHIVIWLMAINHCKNKAVMFFPIWFIYWGEFDSIGRKLCKYNLALLSITLITFFYARISGLI